MCDKKGIYSSSCNPYGGKLDMGKDGENVYVSVCRRIINSEPYYLCIRYVVCQVMYGS